MATDLWEALYQEKRRMLDSANLTELQVSDFNSFQTALSTLCQKHANKGLPKLIRKLNPSLEYIKSFTAAITSATQVDKTATLIWSGLQILIEVACKYAAKLESIIETTIEYNQSLPLFDTYMALFANEQALHMRLADMYRDYLDFCMEAVSYLKQRPIKAFFRSFLPSSQQKLFDQATKNLRSHRDGFLQQATIIHRITVHKQQRLQAQMVSAITVPNISLTPLSSSAASSRSSVSWPVHTISKAQGNVAFVGRSDILSKIHNVFQTPNQGQIPTGPACCLLYGLGGIGKTTAAIQYAIDYAHSFDATFEIRAESTSELQDGFSSIARKLRLTEEGYTLSQSIEESRQWLQGTDKQWLLLFDNLDDMNDLVPYWPTNLKSRGSILITSQRSRFLQITDGPFAEIELETFNADDGALALFKYLKRPAADALELATAKELSDIVGGLPLVLRAIGGYLAQPGYTLSEFKDNFNQSSKFWSSKQGSTLGRYEKTLSTVFRIAIQELDIDARSLLEVLAFLNPGEIPEEMLQIESPSEEASFLRTNRAEFMDMIVQLQQRQLVARRQDRHGKSYLTLHASLQWALLHDLNQNQTIRQKVFNIAFEVVRRAIPEADPLIIPEPDKWPIYQKYLPQVLSLSRKSRTPLPQLDVSLKHAILLNDISSYMWYEGHNSDCEKLVQQTESIMDHLGYDELSKLRWDNHLIMGILCIYTGVTRRAEGFDRRTKLLAICDKMERSSNVSHEDCQTMRCISLADSACGYLEDENFEKVEGLMQECATIYKQLGTEQELPFHWGRFYHHRAYGKLAQGELLGAIELVKQAVDLQEAHAGVATSQSQEYRLALADMIFHAGDWPQALNISANVLNARMQLNGEFHPQTMASHFATGMLQWLTGDETKAEANMRKCLEPRKAILWSDERQTRARFYLSKFLEVNGDHEEAEQLATAATNFRDKVVQEHPKYARVDPHDERVVYDLMVPMQDIRFTGSVFGSRPAPQWW